MKKFIGTTVIILSFIISSLPFTTFAVNLPVPNSILVRVSAINDSNLITVTSDCILSGNTISYQDSSNLYDHFIITIYFNDIEVYSLTDNSYFNLTPIATLQSFANISGTLFYSPYFYTPRIDYVYPSNGLLSRLQYNLSTSGVQSYTGFVFTFDVSYLDENGALISDINLKLDTTNSLLDDINSNLSFEQSQIDIINNSVSQFTNTQDSDINFLSSLPTANPQTFDNISSDFDNVAVTWLDTGNQYYQAVLGVFDANPIIIAILSMVSICAVVSYIVFGKVG